MSTNDNPTTDQLGHRVPTREEMNEETPDNPDKADPVEAEMRIRAMRYYNER
jgi:hypothetical protein